MATGTRISSLSSPGTAELTDETLLLRSGGGIRATLQALADVIQTAIATATLTFTNKTLTSPTLTTPNIGQPTAGDLTNCTNLPIASLTGVSAANLTVTSLKTTAALGYTTGAGGTVTQATSKSTGVTLNTYSGRITLNGAALAAATNVSFTLTNDKIEANDVIVMNHLSAGTANAYLLNAQAGIGSASINVRNITAGSLSEAIVIAFNVIKGATA